MHALFTLADVSSWASLRFFSIISWFSFCCSLTRSRSDCSWFNLAELVLLFVWFRDLRLSVEKRVSLDLSSHALMLFFNWAMSEQLLSLSSSEVVSLSNSSIMVLICSRDCRCFEYKKIHTNMDRVRALIISTSLIRLCGSKYTKFTLLKIVFLCFRHYTAIHLFIGAQSCTNEN